MDSEWQVDALDLDAYLSRIGNPVGADVGPEARALALLHRAHLAHIPFENIDVKLGRRVSVALADVQAKLVTDIRGGYCYEHGVLFAAVLQRLGFVVSRLLARIGGDEQRPGPRTHMALDVVDSVGDHWLCDVGFGSGLLRPLPLRDQAIDQQGAWAYRLVHVGAAEWELQLADTDRWVVQYRFSTEPQHLADVDMANHYTQTWPASPFHQRLIVVRKDETAVHRLLGRQLSITTPGRPDRSHAVTDRDLPATLAGLGLNLPSDLLDQVVALSSEPP